jgi:serine protease Do
MRKQAVTTFGAIAGMLTLLVSGVGVGRLIDKDNSSESVQFAPIAEKAPPPALRATGQADFVALAKRIGPAVVHIATTQAARPNAANPFGGDEMLEDFWRRFFGQLPPGSGQEQGPSRTQSLGSGFIIDKNGTILTNNHVVENADKILVKLNDQTELSGKVLGRDAKTDIAVIKIDAKKDLPVAPLGDSDRLEVGEWVAAVGSPFGLDNTITAGIVSAKGRAIGAGPYDDFIQTDASVNPGNSGGPLVNIQGEVIGINTAIVSRTGGNMGIGFAISINLVKDLLTELQSKGKVTRGWLGVAVQPVTPDLAATLGLKQPGGALVANINEGSPAATAGVAVGDVIQIYDGREIKDSSQLPLLVARTPVGKTVRLKIVRDTKELTLNCTILALKDKDEEIVAAVPQTQNFGLTVQQVTPQIARSRGLNGNQGLIVSAVQSGSAADAAGMREGDVILEIDRQPVRAIADFETAIKRSANRSLLFLIRRGENNLFLALAPQAQRP